MTKRVAKAVNVELDFHTFVLPNVPLAAKFPFNHADRNAATVDDTVDVDLRASSNPLMITSYTSLDRIIEFLARFEALRLADPGAPRHARLVLGHEPSRTRRGDFRDQRQRFSHEITDYWLHRGISVTRSAQVLAAIRCIEAGAAEIRTSGLRVIHAKVYLTETAVTLGSSNYSHSGMKTQAEANCRFTADQDQDRYYEAAQVAEAIWSEAVPYGDRLLGLLKQLLREVDWKEALGRGCAELLTGRWAARFLPENHHLSPGLWPAQLEGIGQALWVLETVGSVLIADATGSGKTRMGAQLLAALQARRARIGIAGRDPTVIVCPPAVRSNWTAESIKAQLNASPHSSGTLSSASSSSHTETVEAISRATILAIDEAHNYLNRGTARTQLLYGNMAEHIVLFTATPINRGTQDLLAVIDLLGGDNFDDDVLHAIESAWRRRKRRRVRLTPEEIVPIREAIQRFTVRRTKSAFNKLIDRSVEEYRNKAGALCRYPIQDTVSYGCDETREDRRLADEIRNLSTQLLGLGNLREPLRLPKYLADDGVSEQQYLKMRLGSAKGLAAYNVMSRLRSSRAALFEHLRGNEAAKEKFGLGQYNKSDTGNLARIIEKLRHRPPKFYLDVTCPEFLETPANFATACDVELDVYRRIEGCVLEMSASRESAKVELLRSLRKDHERILAFDTCLITLYDLCQRMGEVEGTRVLVATGENKRQRDEVQRHFGLESQTRAIALCSDSLAEGVNLQGASAVVLLDTPSVIRRAEQRIGRIDRMDSPYRQISVYWPNDAEAFAVRSDELFLERYGDVADLLGTNFELPANLEAVRNQHRPITGTELGELITTFETADLNDIRDAFFPVRQLVEGDQALVPADVYESVRTSKARILTAVSVVKSDSTWGFYALAGGSQAVPRWVFVQGISTPLTDLGVVAKKLRERLGKTTTRLPLDERATAVIARDVSLLQQSEENLLPRRKRRALSLLRNMVSTYIRSAGDPRRQRVLRRVRNLIEPVPTLLSFDKLFTEHQKDEVVNLEVIADWWLERVRPAWHQHLLARRRRRAARMTELRKHLVGEPLETEVFESLLAIGDRLWRPALADRIVAVIVGVPDQ